MTQTANADAVRLFHEALAADQANDLNQAFQCLIGCLALDPSLPGAWNNLGMVLNKMRKHQASVAAFFRSHTLAPDQTLPLANYAWALQLAGRSGEAYNIAHTLTQIKEPHNPAHWVNLTQVCLSLNKIEEALPTAQKAFELDPTKPEAKLALALAQLRNGLYAEGLKNYEARMQCNPVLGLLLKYPYSLWRGEDIKDKRLFIPCEQGIGDSVMFLAFVMKAAERAKSVVIHVHHQVLSFYKRNLVRYKNVAVFPTPTELPADIDVFCPSLSLPVAMQLTDQEITDCVWQQTFRCSNLQITNIQKQKGVLNIGICWAGDPNHDNDKYRSSTLEAFMQLAEIPNARLFSLQVGARQKDLDDLAVHGTVKNIAPYIRDVNDTASFMRQSLDLVVTIDSAPAHIAGVMGIPTMLLHGSRSVDWRWKSGDVACPWYSKTEMWRQDRDETWNDLLATVRAFLSSTTCPIFTDK